MDEDGAKDDPSIILSSGVEVKAKAVPPLVIMQVMSQFKAPEPPMWKDPKLGREVPNYDHPDYKKAVDEHQILTSEAQANVLLVFGVEIVSVPDGVEEVKSKDWIEKLELAGIETFPKSKNWRNLQWLKTVAATDANDLMKITTAVGRLSGVTEADVATAEATFQGN
jgi:hypothetical protein